MTIHLRPAALQELQRLLQKSTGQPSQIRLMLEPGGCAEWIYQLSAATTAQPDETVVVCNGLTLVVPTHQLAQLQGLTIDFAEDLMGGGFRFINPQAQQTCGCGNSFSTTTAPPLTNDCSSRPASAREAVA